MKNLETVQGLRLAIIWEDDNVFLAKVEGLTIPVLYGKNNQGKTMQNHYGNPSIVYRERSEEQPLTLEDVEKLGGGIQLRYPSSPLYNVCFIDRTGLKIVERKISFDELKREKWEIRGSVSPEWQLCSKAG